MNQRITSTVFLISFCLSLAFVILVPISTWAKWIIPTFSELVSDASRIARVQIIETRPNSVHRETDTTACGFVHTARVIEAFKGGDGTFSFVSKSKNDPAEVDSDYLVFAYGHPREELEQLLARSAQRPDVDDFLDVTGLGCLYSGSDLHVNDWPQSMIPIELTGKNGNGDVGESLVVNGISPFSGLQIEIREIERNGKAVALIDWREARAMLQKQLAGEQVPLRR